MTPKPTDDQDGRVASVADAAPQPPRDAALAGAVRQSVQSRLVTTGDSPAVTKAPGTDPAAPPRWMRLSAIAAAVLVMSAAGFGLGVFVVHQKGPEVAAMVPMAFYITDESGKLSKLDVRVEGIKIGPNKIPLTVAKAEFDLAALRGPDQAMLIAEGMVPADAVGRMEIEFSAAQATVDNITYALPAPAPLVIESIVAPALDAPAMLVDIDLNASLVTDADGGLAFVPVAAAVYAAPTPHADAAPGTPPAWRLVEAKSAAGVLISAQTEGEVPDLPPIDAGSLRNRTVVSDAAGSAGGLATNASDAADQALDDVFGTEAPDVPATGWMILFDQPLARHEMRTVAEEFGAVLVFRFESLPVAYILATEEQADLLAGDPRIDHIEAEVPLTYDDAQSREAIRVPALIDPITGLRDAAGNQIDGRGIGVAVVDSGIDGTHPDVAYAPLFPGGALVANYKVESRVLVPMVSTDTTSGHGTHVAAIVAGRSTDPLQKGVAPGASLYGFGIGEASTTVWAAQAFDWIVQNGANQNPPIRVVSNSWSAGTTYDPSSVTTKLVNQMVDKGMVVVFSAGNLGGNGSDIRTSAQCQIPTPGVICVAAYHDRDTGTRDGSIASFSSRGSSTDAATWPDLSAPGVRVTSARPMVGTTTGIGIAEHVALSGTSQAAPHVAGAAALLLDGDPALTPAQVEAHLKASTYKFTDGGVYVDGSHHAKGAGLLDVYAAVDRVV